MPSLTAQIDRVKGLPGLSDSVKSALDDMARRLSTLGA